MQLANGIVDEAYRRMLSSVDAPAIHYSRGVIGGLEMLFQNLEQTMDSLKYYLEDLKEKEEREIDDGSV